MTSALADSAADLVRADVDASIESGESAWRELRGARILVTGGTGFVGKWLLESFARANERLALRARMVALSRDPAAFASRHPGLAATPGLDWVRGDVRDFIPAAGAFSHAIHAATDVVADAPPRETFDVIRRGTDRVLEVCAERGVSSLLLVSSGAVYGRQPPGLDRIDEEFRGAPPTTDPATAYGQGKRAAEWSAVAHGAASRCAVRIARCFAFVGPYLPLDRHLAVGNFIADRVAGRTIEVRGDGTAVRSYLYASDLSRWLWTILAKGSPGAAYNVGSEEAIAVGALAQRIAATENGTGAVRFAAEPAAGVLPERYVPSTRKARETLGLEPSVRLDAAISRTLAWARARAALPTP